MCEATFNAVYGSPVLQALVGMNAGEIAPRGPGKDPAHLALVNAGSKSCATASRWRPARSCHTCAALSPSTDGVFDERGFNIMRRMREEAGSGMSLGEFKRVVREQFFMLLRRPPAAQ